MLMVLMTMAIIIVVGTSMLFVTLSSFSNSIADTQQERAYNAALTVSDTLKGSTQLNTIIETYFTKIKENGSAEVQFYNDTDFDNQAVNYTIVNGVKVYVTLSKSPNSSKNTIDKVLVDVTGVKGSQESTVSFEAKSQPAGNSTTIQDTFGNSFVVSNNMGSEKTSPYQIFKRIEGDVSINCFETENGERVMKTRLFNPLVLEGVTGSIYANGDLIIGAVDNMIRVQGNVYVDGNLTIRGLELGGVNLPGLMKKYYNKKYIHYWTYSKTIIGSVVLPFTKPTIVERNGSDAILGEAMYEKLSDGSYRPIQVYDKISHFTLMDMAGDANEYTFWTKNWENGGAAEQVTITLRVEDQNGIWQNIDAEYNQGGINNAQYLGASMYYDQECSKPIVQFPEGGNIYCSGDIIFDTVNYGYVYTYDAGGINTGATDGEVNDDNTQSGTPELGVIENWLEGLKGDVINTKYDYYSLSYKDVGTKDGRIPVQTYIGGNVYCQGRMIIAPDSNTSYVNYKNVEKLGISTYFSNPDIYVGSKVVKNDKFVLNDSGAFLSQIKNKWEEILGNDKKWGDSIVISPVTIDTALNRFNYYNGTLSENPNAMKSFIEAYKEAYEKLKTEGETIERLKEKFEDLDKDGYSYLTGDDYTEFGGTYYDPKSQTDKDAKNIAGFNTPKFNETSNLYIQNSPIRKGTSCGDIEHKNSNGVDPCTLEKYASDDKYRVVQNVDEKDTTRTVVNSYYLDVQNAVTTQKVIGSISYTAALTVRYCEITVNNVFCDGAISVLESKIPGFENAAAVNVKNNYLCSDSVKNELKKASIMDFLKYVLQKNNVQLTDEEILKEYFGIDGNKNNFKAETEVYFNMQTDWNNTITYHEEWGGLSGHWKKADITYERKVIVLRAAMEIDETATWTNSWSVSGPGPKPGNYLDHDKHYTVTNNWSLNGYEFSEWRYVADLMYVVDEKVTNYSGDEGKEDTYNFKGEVIDRNGNKVDISKDKDLKKMVNLIKSEVDGNTNTVNLAQSLFLNYINNENYHTEVFNKLVNDRKLKAYGQSPVSGAEYQTTQHYCEYVLKRECYKTLDYATYTHTVRKNIDVMEFANITGGSELAGYDKLSFVLGGADILASEFLKTDYLIAMFSNGANDFDGIINGLVEGSAIKDGEEVRFGDGDISDQFDAMKRTTSAFKDNSLYGMYLVIDKKYSNVNKDAYVSAIFDEIKSSKFATVVEANANQEQAKENVEKILNDLKEKGDIEEYNAFDIYGSTNEYDGYLGIKSGKTVTDYICADNKKLTKKYVRSKGGDTKPENVESWLTTDTLNNEDSWFNIRIWYYLEPSNEVEDSGSLRLMDFYNKNDENGNHLRADSTFAIDEKYNQTFTALKDMAVDWSNLKIKANRSEVQYTIKQNTYFNFELSNTQVVFAASTDGVDARTRMNFLIDTSEKDIYVFFHCKALDKSKDKSEQTRFLFQKCSFQVTGTNNAYIMLVDDTSFAANAFSLEISNTMLSEDKTDEKVGTHFKSNTYQKYVARFKGHGRELKAWKLKDLIDSIQMQALTEGDPAKVGNMFIVGMGRNNIVFGRGGSVNAMVYIPHGRYSNESSGILNIVPIASSGNNEASIVAKDIYISGSNRGQLIFSSYDAAKIGSQNNNSSGLVMDSLINPDTVSHDTKWVAGDYYYG